MGILSLAVPWYYRLMAVVLLLAAATGFGWIKGASHVQAAWDAEQQAMAIAAAQQRARQAETTVKVVTEYIDRVQIVQGKTRTIIKEVPVYVPAQADADCRINTGFVRLHDAAATNTIPAAPGNPDAAPAGVALSTVAATVAGNYGTCHETAEKLMALQAWIKEMQNGR